jgi:polysaccharide biosynthesis protein PelC
MRNVLARMAVAVPMLLLLAAGCAVTESRPAPNLDSTGSWVLLPMQNYSGTPQAGERAEALLSAMLHQRGLKRLEHYPGTTSEGALPELDERRRYTNALEWARSRGSSYGVTGNVAEWRYKNGPDAEPAVGLTLQIIEVPSGAVLWSAAGARSGWGRESLSGTAQKLLRDLLANVRVNERSP